MIVDYHVHTPYCGHAHGTTVEYVEEALRAGLSEIAFTDHLGRYYLSEAQRTRHVDWGMDKAAVRRYFEEIANLKEAYAGRIVIRTGLEVDFIDGAEDKLRPVIDAFPFDVLLGSLHCLPKFGWRHLSDTAHVAPERIYEEYFAQAQAALRSGIFGSLAHIDFLWRYVKWPRSHVPRIFEWIADTARTAAETGTAIEINANGYLWSQLYRVKGGDPFDFLLERIREDRVPVTMGSDAHNPRHVAKNFAQLVCLLRDKGIRSVCTFEKGKRRVVELG